MTAPTDEARTAGEAEYCTCSTTWDDPDLAHDANCAFRRGPIAASQPPAEGEVALPIPEGQEAHIVHLLSVAALYDSVTGTMARNLFRAWGVAPFWPADAEPEPTALAAANARADRAEEDRDIYKQMAEANYPGQNRRIAKLAEALLGVQPRYSEPPCWCLERLTNGQHTAACDRARAATLTPAKGGDDAKA